jgi:hypothetical protein
MIDVLLRNKAFLTYGFFLFLDGALIQDYMGTKNIAIWNGSNKSDLISLFTTLSKNNKNVYFIVYKWDGVFYKHGDKNALLYANNNAFFDSFKKNHEINKLNKPFKIYSPAINYSSFKHLKDNSEYNFSSLFLIPSPYTKDFTQQPTVYSGENWKSKRSKAIWAGETTGISDSFKGTRQIIHDVCKEHNDLFDFFFTKSIIKKHPYKIHKRVAEATQRGYKIILCIDGWAWPGNLAWTLYSGCLLVIISDFTVGITKDLVPWKHYVPASTDGSDLVKNVNWIFQNMDQAEAIVNNLNELVNKRSSPCKLC